MHTNARPIQWVATLTPVREVSLLATVDFGYWKQMLAEEGLVPLEQSGKARLLAIAADMRFKGIRFQELSFSVQVCPPLDGAEPNAAFLVHAFNSNRFFAFCERVLFSTPYQFGRIHVNPCFPSEIRLIDKSKTVFHAAMAADVHTSAREPTRHQPECWNGPIYLPTKPSNKAGRMFFGRLEGDTKAYPFLPGVDSLSVDPASANGILRALLDSQFTPLEWIIREHATHAKSKTYDRPAR